MPRTSEATNCRKNWGISRAREKAAAERGAPDQANPKDKDQYNFTDPQSPLMPRADGIMGYNAQAAVENRQAGVEESLP